MMPPRLRHVAGFLFGASLVLGPVFAYLGRGAVPQEGAGHDFATPPHLAESGRFRIVAFGSSSTRGYGASREAATYPAQLQAMMNAAARPGARIVVINRGINGNDIFGMLARIDDDILPRRPALVIWQLGSNDALHNVTPQEFESGLRAGVARLSAAGCAVVLIGPQWSPSSDRRTIFEAMNTAVEAVGREASLPVVNRYGLMRRWIGSGALRADELIGPDGLHLTDRGYALMARAVFETLATQVPAVRQRLGAPLPAG